MPKGKIDKDAQKQRRAHTLTLHTLVSDLRSGISVTLPTTENDGKRIESKGDDDPINRAYSVIDAIIGLTSEPRSPRGAPVSARNAIALWEAIAELQAEEEIQRTEDGCISGMDVYAELGFGVEEVQNAADTLASVEYILSDAKARSVYLREEETESKRGGRKRMVLYIRADESAASNVTDDDVATKYVEIVNGLEAEKKAKADNPLDYAFYRDRLSYFQSLAVPIAKNEKEVTGKRRYYLSVLGRIAKAKAEAEKTKNAENATGK